MAQWGRVVAAKSEGLSSIPGAYIIGGEYQLPKVVLWPLDASCSMYITPINNWVQQKDYKERQMVGREGIKNTGLRKQGLSERWELC